MLVDENGEVLSANSRTATFPSRHSLIDVTVRTHLSKQASPTQFCYRDFKAIDQHTLLSNLESCDWSPFDSTDIDVDFALACLNENFGKVLDVVAPIKCFTPKAKVSPPWIDSELASMCKKRDTLGRRFKKTQDNRYNEEYLELAKLVEDRFNAARKSFLTNKIASAPEEKKNIWDELKSLGLLPKSNKDLH